MNYISAKKNLATTFSSEVHFGDELRIVSGDLSL